MSKYIADKITCIEATQDGFVYTSLESPKEGQPSTIACWKKMHKVLEFTGHTQTILKFVCFGDFIFSLAEQGEFIVFNRQKGSIVKKINFETHFDDFLHPNTYLNKLVFSGGEELQLWNIMTEQLVFDFKTTFDKENQAAITCI